MDKQLMDMIIQLVKDGGDSAIKIVLIIQLIGLAKVLSVMGLVAFGLTKIAKAITNAAPK